MTQSRFRRKEVWFAAGTGAAVVGALLLAASFFPTPLGNLSMDDLQHDPYLAANPVPVKLEVRTLPARMQVSYTLGWETKNSRPRKRFYQYDLEGAAHGVTPLVLPLVDKGYSHMWVEFRRGDNVFTREYPAIPTAIEEDFRQEMRYPRLRRQDVPPPDAR